MEPVASDHSATPLSFTATFKIVLEKGHLKDHTFGEVTWSEPLVHGWRFGYRDNYLFTSIHFDGTSLANKTLIISTIRASSDGATTEYLNTQSLICQGEPLILHQFLPRSSFVEKPLISFVATVSSRFGLESQPDATLLSSTLRRELKLSLRNGGFTDIKFHVFSRRRATGGAELPRVAFANSSLLKKKSEYFSNLLSDNGFMESAQDCEAGISGDPEEFFTGSYDYESDSDLEDIDEDDDEEEDEDGDVGEEDGEGDGDEEGDDDGDSDSDSDPEDYATVSMDGSDACDTSSSEHSGQLASSLPVVSPWVNRTVIVKDSAYITWNALLFYLYTGHIAFSPLTADVVHPREAHDAQYRIDHPDCPAPCSPKSMYRLADKLGLDDLKQMAFRKLKNSITPDNIVEEYLSSFTSRYEEARDFELKFLRKHYKKHPTVRTALRKRSAEMLGERLEPDELRTLAQSFFDLFHTLML